MCISKTRNLELRNSMAALDFLIHNDFILNEPSFYLSYFLRAVPVDIHSKVYNRIMIA